MTGAPPPAVHRCRACGRHVARVITEHGRVITVDPEPRPGGSVTWDGSRARYLLTDERGGQDLYGLHWRRCTIDPDPDNEE